MTADALPTDKSPVGYEKFTAVPPPVVQVVAYQEDSAWDLYYSLTYWSVTHDVGSRMVSWSEGFDGIKHDSGIRSEYFDTLFQGDFPYDEQTVLPPDWASANACYGMAMLHEATGNRQVDAQTALKTGGEYVPGQMNLYLLKVAAYNSWYNPAIMNEETDYVPVAKVQVPGWTLTPDMADMNWGDFIVSAPAQATVPMTPTAPGVSDYSFGFQVNQVNLQPAVDANRDGSITFDSQDQTSSANYYRFWVNDDQDDAYAGDVVPVTARDCDDFIINSPRDLEDLSRLHLLVQGLTNELAHGTFLLGLKWKNVTGTPSINIFPAAETNGGTLYLTDTNVAIQQAPAVTPCPTVLNNANNYHQVDTSGTFLINSTFWQTAGAIATNSVAHLLFEGCAVGKGQLVVTINKPDGTELAEAGSVWLDIKDIKAMYQRAVTTPSDDSFAPPYNQSGSAYYANSVFDESSLSYSIGTSIAFDKPQDETPQCVVFVHGWNMDDNEYLSFSETMFKRFWWQGYKGRFCAFHWATLTGFTTYNTSEFRAWKYGLSLKKYVESLKANLSGYTMNIVAHSMGNIVTSSALNRGLTVDNYVLLQAAVPAGCYDTSSGINSYGVFATAEASKTTPDLAVPDMGYRGYLANVSGNLVNFYNANDFALATGNLATFTHIPFLWWIDANWEANEVESKPDYFTSQVYNYDSTQTLLQRGQLLIRHAGPTYTVDHYVTDPQESMSFVARPRSKAVGALADVGGTITSQVDLNANFGFDRNRDEHSAEFNWNIQRVGGFYSELLSDLLPQHP
jgi:pimeloyl-ACP methyl ester carboxylesterase